MILRDAMAPEGGEAGAALAAPAAGEGGGSAAATVPMDMLPGCKPGDTYTVKSVDGGNVTLEHAPGAGGADAGTGEWGEGLTQAAPRGEEM